MNRSLVVTCREQTVIGTIVLIFRHFLIIGLVTLGASLPAISQSADLQQKLAAVKQAAAENKQKLRQYQWTESTQLTLKGDAKPASQFICQYGPDGQVQKTMISSPPPPSGGRLKQRVIENKKEEMQDYMKDVKAVLSMYVPPNAQIMQQSFQSGKVSLNPGGGIVNLVFRDYALPGDQMTLSFDPDTKKIVNVNVNTYMGQTKDAVTLQVQMGSLPDGTNYAQQTVLNASAKQLVVTTTSFNYQRLSAGQ
jgi:hypothetical protein